MAACFASLFVLLLAVSVVREAGGVISGPLFPRNKGLIEPMVLEIPENEELPELARRAMQERPDRLRRQSSSEEEETADHIGTLTPLTGDRHTFALVHWTGHPSEDIFILTRRRDSDGRSTESWLWRSKDYGKTFVNETDKFDNDTVIEWYYISPNQSNLIMMDRINQRLWVTTDEGETYNSYPVSFTPDRLIFQSTLAPGSLEGSLALHVLAYDAAARGLWVSEDLGMNWRLLDSGVVPSRYYWRVLGGEQEDATAVYYEKTVNDTVSELKWGVAPYQTTDSFDGDLGHFAVNTFVLSHEYMLVQKTDVSSDASEYSSPLWVSHNRGSFKQAQFPLRTPEKHYSVVDASEGQIFIAVYHTFNNTNLYLSEEAGLSYALSLEFIVSPPESDWEGGYPTFDVHVVEGIVGTYIANRQVPNNQFGATVISFDKGGEWNLVIPPASDYNNQPIFCVPPECSLHLHMESDRTNGYQSILSQDSAIGLIMALGNLGSSLERSRGNLRLYFSHDGGFSWQEVNQQFWEFQFAALGSIVVTIPKWRATNIVRWSCDEGAVWNETHFVDEQIRVVGMLTERGEKANHVTIFGYSGFGFREWLVIDLNFTQVVPNQCVAPNDYYQWIPTDERPGSRCLLGEVVAYERRRSEECCVVDPNYEKPVIRAFCTCAIEDFECDFGFERVNLNSPCTPMDSIVWPPLPPPGCSENETYNYTSGYRMVAGDKCVPGNETYFFPIVRNCPVASPLGLFIQYSPSNIAPRQAVTFTLTQLVGSVLVTNYSWSFNDSTPRVNGTGLEHSRVQTHSFDLPGVYTVKVTATNTAGQSEATVDVSVLDTIQSVVLILPPTYQDGVVPVGTELALQANYTTQHGSNVVGHIFAIWNFGDSESDTTLILSTSHTYNASGNFTLMVTVNSPLGSVSAQTAVSTVQAPLSLTLTVADPDQLGAEKTVTFNLQQVPEYTGFTQYTYNYGDSSADHFSSLAEAGSVQHTYRQPGPYVVTVTATNIAGQGSQSTTINVLDLISTVSIVLTDYPDRRVPVGVQLVYKASYTTQHSTDLTGRLSYTWDWGDESGSTQGHTSSVTHVYSDVGSYTLTLTVSNGVSTVSAPVIITTYTPTNPQIISDGVFFNSGFVEVNKNISLRIEPGSGESSRPDATFTWNITGPDGITVNATSLSYDFPLPGTYQVSVKGNRSAVFFLSSKTIMAEYSIAKLQVVIRPTIHADNVAMANVTVFFAANHEYIGPLNLTLMYNGSYQPGTYFRNSSEGVKQLSVNTGKSGMELVIVFMAGNDISSATQEIKNLVVVGPGQFGTVRLSFNVDTLPSNFDTEQWQAELKNAIIDYLRKKYGLELWQLEVSIVKVAEDLRPTKRQAVEGYLLVDFNVLPKSLEPTEINSTMRVAMETVDMSNNNKLSFSVSGQNIAVEKAQLNPDGVVIVDGKKKNFLPLGAGLGGGLIVLVALAVLAIALTVYYRRKYSRLRVRYTRLQQGPVRFTFTPGGQMVEDDDYDDDDEGAGETQMETLQSDDDDKPVL